MQRKASIAATPAIEVDASTAGTHPLGMAPADFLRDYWQKKPLLIRNAFPGYLSPIEPEDLAGLACEEMALSRLIRFDPANDAWSVRSGPFDEDEFPGLPRHDWTLLVQDVDKWDAEVAQVLQKFDFLPRWRIDDVMVSFAAPGGSVGAHVDQYDVFLLQAQGRRRWQIDASPAPPLGFRDDVELKLLSEFTATHDWVLAPGDMLYLPPGVPHHGVAEDACLTFSIGMRAPSAAELLGDYVDTLSEAADESLRYRDPDLAPARDTNEIDDAALHRAVQALNALRTDDPARLADWFGRFVTTYRSAGVAMAPPEPLSGADIDARLRAGGSLHRNPFTRMAWSRAASEARLFVAGHAFELPVDDASRLCAEPTLDAAAHSRLSRRGRDCVQRLAADGHYSFAEDDE